MRELLVDLYRHQEWADAEIWRACELHASSFDDRELWERQCHLHVVQRAFLHVVRGDDMKSAKFKKPDEYEGPSELKAEARRFHTDVLHFLDQIDDAALERGISIPWFKDPPISLKVGEALLQAVMHSQYHRGQQSARLRALGGTPPNLDYIFWIWKGRAAPQWS